ncbi:retention module-containing protein, partial [Hydrogenophaga aquatica]
MAKFATVASVNGNAVVVGLDGTVRPLKVGDIIQKGEIVRTAAGARVELVLEDGQTMAVAPEQTVRVDEAVAQTESTPASQEAALQGGTVDQILQVLEQGGDLTQELEAAAAGGGAGSGGDGSDFVRLLRVTEGVDPLAYEYSFQPLPGPEEVLLSAAAPAVDAEPVVGNVTLRYILLDEEGQPVRGENGGFVYIDGDDVIEGTPVGLVAEVDVPPTGSALVLTLSNGQTITIPVGESFGFVPLEIRGDDQYIQGTDLVDVAVTGASGGQYDELNIDQGTSISVVDDDDATTVSLNSPTVNEGGNVTITATVTNAPQGNLVLTLSNGQQITILSGETSGSVTFPVQGDDPYKDGETFELTITDAEGGNYEDLDTSGAVATVTVNDTIDDTVVTLNDVTVSE